jgi:hypothetical protein
MKLLIILTFLFILYFSLFNNNKSFEEKYVNMDMSSELEKSIEDAKNDLGKSVEEKIEKEREEMLKKNGKNKDIQTQSQRDVLETTVKQMLDEGLRNELKKELNMEFDKGKSAQLIASMTGKSNKGADFENQMAGEVLYNKVYENDSEIYTGEGGKLGIEKCWKNCNGDCVQYGPTGLAYCYEYNDPETFMEKIFNTNSK